MNITCRKVSYKYKIRLRLPQGIRGIVRTGVCVDGNDYVRGEIEALWFRYLINVFGIRNVQKVIFEF